MRTRLRAAAACVVLAIASACGGGTEGDDEVAGGATVPTGSRAPTAYEVGDAIVTALGSDAGFAAVLYALDAGYSVDQLAAGAFGGTLTANGDIPGVDPVGVDLGLIAPPAKVAGFTRTAADGEVRTAEQVQAAIEGKVATDVTIGLLTEPWLLAPETDLVTPLQDEAESAEGEPTSTEAATAMIGVIIGLMDVGYSFDQALNGWLFGEMALGIGVHLKSEKKQFETCITLRGADGVVVQPANNVIPTLDESVTCASAIRAGAVTYGDADELIRLIEEQRNGSTDPPTTDGSVPDAGGGAEPGEVRDGSYAGEVNELGAIFDVEVGDNSAVIVVESGAVTGFSLSASGRYSACFGGYGDESTVSCTIWLTWNVVLSGGPVSISGATADVPVNYRGVYSDCETELASECDDWDEDEDEAGVARISITDRTISGVLLFDGQEVGIGFTAALQ